MARTILVVEDDVALLRALSRYLSHAGHRVVEAHSCSEAYEKLSSLDAGIDIVLTDVSLPDGVGFDIADKLAEDKHPAVVIVMTGDDRITTAITAFHRGVADFLLKPFSFEALDQALERVKPQRRQNATQAPMAAQASAIRTPGDAWRKKYAPDLIGTATQLERVFAIIERVADTDCTVIVSGESGTGKELVARALHMASDRRTKALVTVNCAALPENLIESELFGHARGSFTGATNSREGRFTAADGGTIFLDEVGELPLAAQAKLLRVLQEKEVTPVGESKAHKVDVRVIAATNRDLEDMVANGTFREDLLYRLAVIPIELPPLRERRGDIPELVRHFIARTNAKRERSVSGINKEAMDILCGYDWPGNVRELENKIERMVVLRSEGELAVEDIPAKLRAARPALAPVKDLQAQNGEDPLLPDDGIDLKDAVERYENALIVQALERTGWNKNRAAAILRMNRTTLVEKLKKKGMMDEDQARVA